MTAPQQIVPQIFAVPGEVAGCNAVNDMMYTGGSLMGALRAYVDAGTSTIDVVATHGIFTVMRFRSYKRSAISAA